MILYLAFLLHLADAASCDSWCEGKGFTGGMLHGAAPACGASCEANCPDNPNEGCTMNTGDMDDSGHACWTGGKACCCSTDRLEEGAECGAQCDMVHEFMCPPGLTRCVATKSTKTVESVTQSTYTEFNVGAEKEIPTPAGPVSLSVGASQGFGESRTLETEVAGQTVFVIEPNTLLCHVNTGTATPVTARRTTTGCAWGQCKPTVFTVVDCSKEGVKCTCSENQKCTQGCGLKLGTPSSAISITKEVPLLVSSFAALWVIALATCF